MAAKRQPGTVFHRPAAVPRSGLLRRGSDAPTQLSPTLSASAASPEVVALGEVVDGRYRLVEQLGSGATGVVYQAFHETLETPVAMKVLHRHIAVDPEYARRFRREAKVAMRLTHPSIVRVLDLGEVHDTFYLVMEFIEGRTLSQYLADGPDAPLPVEEVGRLVRALVDALAAVHEEGLVHRDIKPDNIILDETKDPALPKLVDFGLVHLEDDGEGAPLTKTGVVAGTPAYMSPEQCRSLSVGPASDLYALGCVLTELLQGAPPFSADSAMDLVAKHLFVPPPPLERAEDAEPVPPEVERIRLWLLKKNASERPKSASDLREPLREAFGDDAAR